MIQDDAEAWVRSAGTLGGSLLVRASKERIEQMRRQLAEMESQLLHPVLCEIQLFRQMAGRKEWVGEATPVLLAGGRAAFGAYHRLDYIGDYDVAVAQESRIADPVHMHATEGLIGDEHILAELGDVLAGLHAGRTDAEQVTLFKSLGIGLEDVAAAQVALRNAERMGVGTVLDIGGRR